IESLEAKVLYDTEDGIRVSLPSTPSSGSGKGKVSFLGIFGAHFHLVSYSWSMTFLGQPRRSRCWADRRPRRLLMRSQRLFLARKQRELAYRSRPWSSSATCSRRHT